MTALLAAAMLATCTEPPAMPRSCNAAPSGWLKGNVDLRRIRLPQINHVRLDRSGDVSWNGVPLGGMIDFSPYDMLATYLQMVGHHSAGQFVTLNFDKGTRCRDLRRVRALMERNLACSASHRCLQGDRTADLAS